MEASCDASIPGVPPIKTLLLISLLAVAVVLPFLPVLSNDFVNFDDPAYVTENELIRLPPLEAIRRAVTSFDQANWHPLTLLSHALDVRLFGLNPAGHHAHNLLLHVGKVTLLFAWLRLMGVAPAGAWWGALLFGVHPLRVEPVAWAAERKDVLCAFLFLAALVSFTRYRLQTRSRKLYLAALDFHALALIAKPMG